MAQRHRLQSAALSVSQTAARIRAETVSRLQQWAEAHIEWLVGGAASLDEAALTELASAEQTRLMQTLCACVAGEERLLQASQLELLLQSGAAELGATIGGCYLRREYGRILVSAEPGRAAGALTERLGQDWVWNGRIRLSGENRTDRSPSVRNWGEAEIPARLRELPLPEFAVRRVLPLVADEKGQGFHVPHLEPDVGFRVSDLGPKRFLSLLEHRSEFFLSESRVEESFS